MDTHSEYLLEDKFSHEDKDFVLSFSTNGIISWTSLTPKSDLSQKISLSDLLIVRGSRNDHHFLNDEHRRKRNYQKPNISSIQDSSLIKPCYSFELHFIRNEKQNLMVECAIFCSSKLEVVNNWIERLQNDLDGLEKRPKNLLVFINPYGGRKKGLEIYEKQVQPLFNLMEIQTRTLITERANHAHDFIIENGWQDNDGIVCVGGDGTLSEIVNGVLTRSAQDRNVNLNDIDVEIPSSNIRIGIIPAGSTDTIVYSLHGTSDVQTAVIHILLGDFLKSDLCTAHSRNEYLGSFMSIMSYGILGDVIKNSIGMRWMGPFRYECAGARHFLCHKSYEGTVSFEKDLIATGKNIICLKNNCHCVTERENHEVTDEKKWELIRGKFFMVTAANISCSCSRSPNGIAPNCHFSDGYLCLLLIRNVTFCEKLKLLFTLSNSNKAKLVNNLDFVEMYKTKRFEFETGYGSGVIPATKISSWNVDGELMQKSRVHVRCHRQKIGLFCRKRIS